MKKEILINSDKRHVLVQVHTAATLLATGAAGEETQDAANAEKLRVSAKLVRAGVTGAYILKEGEQTKPFYLIEDGVIKFAMLNLPIGYNRLTIVLQYGTNEPSVLVADVNVLPDADTSEWYVHDEYDFDAVKTMGGAGGGGMQQYILGYSNGHITHDGQPLTFAQVKAAVEDTSKFVYLDFANALHLPCFIVDSEGNSAVAFSAAFQVSGAPYIERVAINEQEEVKIDNMRCVHFNEVDGVAIGYDCEASGDYSHAEGGSTIASGYCSHAEGDSTTASEEYSHAEGSGTTASGYCSHAEGDGAIVSGSYSHAEGGNTTASGDYSHVEGENTEASGFASHAEGGNAKASDDYSHAEGDNTKAIAPSSHAEGGNTTASGDYSHAEGDSTIASDSSAHSEGANTKAGGPSSHAEGWGTETNYDDQHAQGCWNNADDFADNDGAFMHGCGTEDDRKNAFAIGEDGKIYVIGLGGYDGTNHEDALSLQDLLATSNIQASTNKAVNGYQVPNLTPAQVTAAYNAVVAGRYVTITDATGNYHLGVTQADVLNGDLAISLIFLNVMLLTYEISGSTVDVQFKNL